MSSTITSSRNQEQIIDSILDNLDVAEQTKEDYRHRIPCFLEFLSQNGLNHQSYIAYKNHLRKRNDITVSTKNKYLIVARLILQNMFRIGAIPTDITSAVKLFTDTRAHKQNGLTEEELKQITAHLGSQSLTDLSNIRTKSIICLLVFQGLRQCEVARLDIQDIDLHSGTARIHGKARDEKEKVYLYPYTVKALEKYIVLWKVRDGALYFSSSNKNRNQRLSTRSIRDMVKNVFSQLDIKKNVHGTRHFFVTKLIKDYKSDLTSVMRYSRHRSLETLKVYNDAITHTHDLPRFYASFNEFCFA